MKTCEKIKDLVDDVAFRNYFEGAVYTDDGIELANKYHAKRVRERYIHQLCEVFDGKTPTITFREKFEAEQLERKKDQSAEVTRFPYCPIQKRFSPNVLLRSAVFAAVKHPTRYLREETIAIQHGYDVKFTGIMLSQSDFDVWLQAAQIAKDSPLGTVCTTTSYSLLKNIGRKTCGASYAWLKSCIVKLQASVISISVEPKSWQNINLITNSKGDDETKEIQICFSPDIIKLFAPDDWTALQWQERKALKNKPLALWLHGYYSSHAKAHPLKVKTLLRLSGSETRELKHFKAALKRAFKQLQEVVGFDATFEQDLVHVKHRPSPTQAKHLKKKK